MSVPTGHHENSPAFQRWDDRNEFSSPAGTSEIGAANLVSCSGVPSGLALRLAGNPALKRWAFFKCPSGTCGSPTLNFRTTFGPNLVRTPPPHVVGYHFEKRLQDNSLGLLPVDFE